MKGSNEADKQQLDEIITLRNGGASWEKIGKALKIDRRTASDRYEKWERDSSEEELRKVRMEVAAIEFRAHLDSLVTLADSFTNNLGMLPNTIDDVGKNGEEFLNWLMDQDLLQRYTPSKPQQQPDDFPLVDGLFFRNEDPHKYLDEKKLLYNSLREHTRGEVRWSTLDNDWTDARNKCAESVPQFIKETRKVVNTYLNGEPKFLEKVKKATGEADPAENMTRIMVNGIWRLIMTNQLKDQERLGENPLFKNVEQRDNLLDMVLNYNFGTSTEAIHFMGSDRKYLAEKITKYCNSTIRVMVEEQVVRELHAAVVNIRISSGSLREMLNPLKLRPLILRTRCDLCPV